MAGCHATTTIETIRLANFAEKLGYDCIWISPTLPRKATDRELLRHHRMVLEQTSAPIAIYDANPITHYLTPRLLGEIAALGERFVAMKSIVADLGHIAALHDGRIDRHMRILGVESTMLAHLQLGSPGALAGSEWVPLAVALYRAFRAGRMERAWQLQKAVLAQVPLMLPRTASLAMGASLAHSGIGYIKARFGLMSGIDIGPPMPPYEPADEHERSRAAKEIEALKRIVAEGD